MSIKCLAYRRRVDNTIDESLCSAPSWLSRCPAYKWLDIWNHDMTFRTVRLLRFEKCVISQDVYDSDISCCDNTCRQRPNTQILTPQKSGCFGGSYLRISPLPKMTPPKTRLLGVKNPIFGVRILNNILIAVVVSQAKKCPHRGLYEGLKRGTREKFPQSATGRVRQKCTFWGSKIDPFLTLFWPVSKLCQ